MDKTKLCPDCNPKTDNTEGQVVRRCDGCGATWTKNDDMQSPVDPPGFWVKLSGIEAMKTAISVGHARRLKTPARVKRR